MSRISSRESLKPGISKVTTSSQKPRAWIRKPVDALLDEMRGPRPAPGRRIARRRPRKG